MYSHVEMVYKESSEIIILRLTLLLIPPSLTQVCPPVLAKVYNIFTDTTIIDTVPEWFLFAVISAA